jgi:hypothetical protein
MNEFPILLQQLHESETHLAKEFRRVATREAVEQDVYYLGHRMATMCDSHAEKLRAVGERHGADLDPPEDSSAIGKLLGSLQHTASEMVGRNPDAGLLLLRDLRELYLMAQEASIHWIALGQVAQAVRDPDLLGLVSELHTETITQIKWLKTKIREATPPILVVPV